MKKQIKRLAIILPLLALCGSIDATAKSKIVQDFNPVCDSLLTLNHERTGISGKLIPTHGWRGLVGCSPWGR